jgi:single-stranded-DNA-specific exonuclease
LSESGLHWIEPAAVVVPPEIRELAGGPWFLAEALVRRGLADPVQLRGFLDPHHYTPTPPSDLTDLSLAADRLEHAIRHNQHIGVWGDFDVDGQTSTALLVQALRGLGAKVSYYIPVRARESHGVALPALQTFLQQGVELILTCDTGVTAHEAAIYARAQGVDLIITDHHTLPDELPIALAVVNPQRFTQPSPLSGLCGVGCAYKLAEELYRRANRAAEAGDLLDFVALGTVADLAQLSGDNRYLVQRGLERLRSAPRPAIAAMLELAEVAHALLSEEQISFTLAPRLNALGRLEDANPVVPFLLATSLAAARPMATRLEGLNARRKLLCDQVFQAAQAQLVRDHSLLARPVLLLAHPNWPSGVLGIVASRLVDLYHKPVILMTTPPGELARGSARSVEGINITQAIASAAPLLSNYGGHPMAAGLGLDPAKIPEFQRTLERSVTQQSGAQPILDSLAIDSFLPLENLTLDLVEALDRLAPFGPGNPGLILATRSLSLQSHSAIGKSGEHLQLIVEDAGGVSRKVMWWQGAGSPLPEGRFDLAYTVRANNYRGQRAIQVEWVGFRALQESLGVAQPKTPRSIQDLRDQLDPLAALGPWLARPEAAIFAEGELDPVLRGRAVDRYHVEAAATLVLWSLPPGRTELQALLDSADPRQVVWLGVNTAADQLTPFLTRLSGLVRYALKNRAGQITLPELVAATGQRERTLRKGLAWLTARGHITCQLDDTLVITLTPGAPPDPAALPALERDLNYLLQETAAFRAYCQKADLQTLVH